MAQIKEFELLHGVVLTKLLRTDGAALRLIETDEKKAWAAYTVNDSAIVYVKYRLTNRETKKDQKKVWNFPINVDEVSRLAVLSESKPLWMALVCGLPEIERESIKTMQVCLLSPDDIRACISLQNAVSQVITAEYKPNGRLRAYGPNNSKEEQKLVIPRNRLDEWVVPGS